MHRLSNAAKSIDSALVGVNRFGSANCLTLQSYHAKQHTGAGTQLL